MLGLLLAVIGNVAVAQEEADGASHSFPPVPRAITPASATPAEPDKVIMADGFETITTLKRRELTTDCPPQDSESCLQASSGWLGYFCATSTSYCTSHGKDMQRCCPVSCRTGALDEAACNALGGQGTCDYPNDAQNPTCDDASDGTGSGVGDLIPDIPTCTDTDDGAKDSDGNGCSEYYGTRRPDS